MTCGGQPNLASEVPGHHELVHLVARELAQAGWRLREITTDNGSEFRSKDFGAAVAAAGASQRRIKAGGRTRTAASSGPS